MDILFVFLFFFVIEMSLYGDKQCFPVFIVWVGF